MQKIFFLFTLIPIFLASSDILETIKEREKEAQELLKNDAWFKSTLSDLVKKSENIDLEEIKKKNQVLLSKTKPCTSNTEGNISENIKIFVSLSMPMSLWQQYSEELIKVGGVFVLNGLPENSFQALAKTMLNLKKNGVKATLILDPIAFRKYQINSVPTIVIEEENVFDKISGSVSLAYALEKFSHDGETKSSPSLLKKLRGKDDD